MVRSELVEDNISIREKNDGNLKDGILIESTNDVFEQGNTWPAKLQRLARKFKIEQRGIERVPENERTDINGVINVGTMVRGTYFIFIFPLLEGMMIFFAQWLAANMAVSSFAIGALATPVFFLGFMDSILAILFFNLLGILPVAFFSTFGPVFGLRQMVLSRFFFGYYGVKISARLVQFRSLSCIECSNIFSCCAQHSYMYWLVLC
jgi:hypothetical protein